MSTLQEFYTLVSSEVKRGSALDSVIPAKVAMAVLWMEREHTFKHMDKLVTTTISSSAAQPRMIGIPGGFKKMNFWRLLLPVSGQVQGYNYARLTQVDGYDFTMVEVKQPKAYFQDGNSYFVLDSIPDQDYPSELSYVGRTVLPNDTAQSPDIIQRYPDLLLFQTMCYMSAPMRNDKVAAFYKPLRDESMKSAIDDDVEARQSARSESMKYGWEYTEDVNNVSKTPIQ